MGVLLALYWSVPSVKTSSVAKAYFLPFRGLEGAGEGGRSWPSKSSFEKAFPRPFDFLGDLSSPLGGWLASVIVCPLQTNSWFLSCTMRDARSSIRLMTAVSDLPQLQGL